MGRVSEGNKTFRILSCIGILLIMLGHLNCNILEFGGLFPYYSYHVMIFVFISGYFYKKEDETNLKEFLLRKFKRLMLPYLLINALYGVITVALREYGFIFDGGNISLRDFFFEPFYTGHQYMLIAPGWFIPALFLFEICNVFGRKILGYVKLKNEYVLLVIYLLIGIACVALSKHGSVYDLYRIPARIMFMGPVIQLGRVYRVISDKWHVAEAVKERNKIFKNEIFLAVIGILGAFAINVILRFTAPGLAFSAAWVNGFAGNVLLPYITTVTGIGLWVSISSLIAKIRWDALNKAFVYAGSRTFSICVLHLSAFFIVNLILSKMQIAGFDSDRFASDVYYAYEGFGNAFKLIYVIIGLIIPLLLEWCVFKLRSLICGLQIIGKTTK